MITFRGGGGKHLPAIVIFLPPTGFALGGASRMTHGFGAHGSATPCRIISGGAGPCGLSGSCVIIILPGAGPGGGFKNLTPCTTSTSTLPVLCLFITLGSL